MCAMSDKALRIPVFVCSYVAPRSGSRHFDAFLSSSVDGQMLCDEPLQLLQFRRVKVDLTVVSVRTATHLVLTAPLLGLVRSGGFGR